MLDRPRQVLVGSLVGLPMRPRDEALPSSARRPGQGLGLGLGVGVGLGLGLGSEVPTKQLIWDTYRIVAQLPL